LKINDLTLENNNFKIQKEYENEIKNLKQNILQLKSEHNICLKQKDDKISSLENALKNVINLFFI